MKIITLLNKMYNKDYDLPDKIYFEGETYYLDNYDYYSIDNHSLGYDFKLDTVLNDEVTIAYKDKAEIKKFLVCVDDYDDYKVNGYTASLLEREIASKINEIIDYIQENK